MTEAPTESARPMRRREASTPPASRCWLIVMAWLGAWVAATPALSHAAESVWFAEMSKALPLPAAESWALRQHVAGRVVKLLRPGLDAGGEAHAPGEKEKASPVRASLPAGAKPFEPGIALGKLQLDSTPRAVLVSISDGKSPARVYVGVGAGAMSAADRAVAAVRADKATWVREPDWPVHPGREPRSPAWLKVDIVATVTRIGQLQQGNAVPIEPTVHGIAFSQGTPIAVLPGEVWSWGLIDSDRKLRLLAWPAYLRQRAATLAPKTAAAAKRGLSALEQPVFRFDVDSVFFNLDQTPLVAWPLKHGRRAFDHAVTASDAKQAAEVAGAYLTKAVFSNGRFVYEYNPASDQLSRSYNLLRHAGTIYAMAELYGVTRDRELMSRMQGPIGFLLKQCRVDAEATKRLGDQASRIKPAVMAVYDNRAKLGGAGLALLALSEYTRVTADKRHLRTMQGLARWIHAQQRPDGSYVHMRQVTDDADNGKDTGFRSWYYPGEANFALAKLYTIDGDKRWLDVAERSLNHIIFTRDKGVKDRDLKPDHWMLYALNEMHKHRPKAVYVTHAMRIAHSICDTQQGKDARQELVGGFGEKPTAAGAATRGEGLGAAIELARRAGPNGQDRAKDAARFLEALRLANAFQLRCQYRPERSLYLRYPTRTLGAFHTSLTHGAVRVDGVQHSISSMLAQVRAMGE